VYNILLICLLADMLPPEYAAHKGHASIF